MAPGTVAVTWQQANLSIPGGIPVGTIVANQGAVGSTRTATVKAFVDFDSLDLVGIVVVLPRTDPRDAIVPSPQPTATATATPSASGTGTANPKPSASHS
jgi:rod shape-determining protein MreC